MLALLTAQPLAAQFRPVVLLHGLLAESEAMQHAEGWIKQDFPGIYVHNAKVPTSDKKMDSLFMNLNDQIAALAGVLKNE